MRLKLSQKTAWLSWMKKATGITLVFLLPALWFYNGVVRGSDVYFTDRSLNQDLQPIELISSADPFNEPIVSVVFDDGWESIYSNGLPMLHAQGIATTQYVLASEFNNPTYVSEDQVRHMYQLGHEIGSHGLTHSDLKYLDDASLRNEITQSKLILERITQHPINDFASPFGSYDKRTANAIRSEYRSHRTTQTKINQPTNSSFSAINGHTITRDMRAEDIKELIVEALKTDGWLVLVYHDIDYDQSEYGVTPEQLYAHMEILRNSDIKIATLGSVVEALQERYDG